MNLKTNFRIIIFLYLLVIVLFIFLRSLTVKHFDALLELYRDLENFERGISARKLLVYEQVLGRQILNKEIENGKELNVKNLVRNSFLKYIILKNKKLRVYFKSLDSLYGDMQEKLIKFNSLPNDEYYKKIRLREQILSDVRQIDSIGLNMQLGIESFLRKWKSRFYLYNLLFFSVLIAILLIATILALYSTRVLNRSVKAFNEASESFEKTDFKTKIEVKNKTEFWVIAKRLNRAKEIVRSKIALNFRFINEVLRVASLITKSTRVVYLSAIKEAKSAEKLFNLIEEIDTMLSENIDLINNSWQVTQRFAEATEVIRTNISEIADFIEQMLSALTEISKVANKIDFLAINSAIEAVKAGENARGFKVIAREIRDLANSTKSLADKIIVMSRVGVVQIENTIKQSLSSFEHVDNLIHFTTTISDSFKQQVQMLDELKQNISLLSESSQEHANLAHYLTNTAKYLRKKSLILKETLKDFKV